MGKISVDKELLRASFAFRKGKSMEALSIYEDILRIYPNNSRAKLALSKLKKGTPDSKQQENNEESAIKSLSVLYQKGNKRNLGAMAGPRPRDS